MAKKKEKDVILEMFALANNNVSVERGIKNFSTHKLDGKWVIRFSISMTSGYILYKKDDSIRYFARLNGVEVWMKKMKITSFMVNL